MSSLVELIAAKQKQVINENFNLTNKNYQVLGNLRGFPYGLDNVYNTNIKYKNESGSNNPFNNITQT